MMSSNAISGDASGETFLFTSESVGEGHPGKYHDCFIFQIKFVIRSLMPFWMNI